MGTHSAEKSTLMSEKKCPRRNGRMCLVDIRKNRTSCDAKTTDIFLDPYQRELKKQAKPISLDHVESHVTTIFCRILYGLTSLDGVSC